MTAKPWGAMDPNSAHQLWSRWTLTVEELGRTVGPKEMAANIPKWLTAVFGSVGRARFNRHTASMPLSAGSVGVRFTVWEVTVEIEGKPAHDPAFVGFVEREWAKVIEKGWGRTAVPGVSVKILAGDEQDGAPRKQLVVMPTIDLRKLE